MTPDTQKNFNERLKYSDHYKDGRFFNPSLQEPKGFLDFLKWQFTRDKAEWPKSINPQVFSRTQDKIKDSEVKVTFINHSTFLLEFNGLTILTDPIWSQRASPVTFAGPKRVQPPGLLLHDLPKIDAVLISHNHYDHLDLASLKSLDQKFKPKFFVGLGDKKLLEGEGIENVTELDWNDEVSLFENSKIVFLKCRHWSARGITDRFKSLWGAYLIQHQGVNVYFAGDTGYAEHFVEASTKYPGIDVALLPVGAYEPRWFMKNFHMNPADSIMAAKDLGAKVNLGMHLETFQLTDESFQAPREEIDRLLKLKENESINFSILYHGQSYHYHKEKK